MENNIILSICIPTYNRSSFLKKSILSIVNQKRFQQTNDVEVIISDNCSDDDTKMVALEFVKSYGDKIRYYRNESNVTDLNFKISLSYGKGLFLKLSSDTMEYREDSLDKIIQTILEHKNKKRILFFSNGTLDIKENILCNSLDEFITNVSYYSGWIVCFGLWKDDFLQFEDFNRYVKLKLPQVDVLFRLIDSRKAVCINNEKLFDTLQLPKIGGYDFLDIFMDNYIYLLKEQFTSKSITEKTFTSEKRKLLIGFIRPWFVKMSINPHKYFFYRTDAFKRIFKCYRMDIVACLIFIIRYIVSIGYNYVKIIIRRPGEISP